MNLTLLGVILILGGYLYGTLLYDPWYARVQHWLVIVGMFTLPPDTAEDSVRLLGTKARIATIGVIAIIAGIWVFVLGGN